MTILGSNHRKTSRQSNILSQTLAQSHLQFKVSVTQPSDAFNAGMAKQIEGHRLAQKRKSLPSASSFVV
jgi:hypothetical protein